MEKKTTIYHIANETNLSIATVSRVINNKGGYSKETEQKVLDTIRKLGYSPSSSAQSLASSSTRTIGLIYNFSRNFNSGEDYLVQFLSGVTAATNQYNYDILLDSNSIKQHVDAPSIINRGRFDGIVLPALSSYGHNLVKGLLSYDFPVVYTGPKLEDDEKGCNVYGGYGLYKREVLELLYKKGHRHIVFFEAYNYDDDFNYNDFNNIIELKQIINSFCSEKDLPHDQCRLILYDYSSLNQFQLLVEDVLSANDRPDAISIDSTRSVNIAYNVIQRLHLRIPGDISIISTSHQKRIGEEFSPALSIVYVNAFEMGKSAAELLISKIEKFENKAPKYIPYQMIVRNSIKL